MGTNFFAILWFLEIMESYFSFCFLVYLSYPLFLNSNILNCCYLAKFTLAKLFKVLSSAKSCIVEIFWYCLCAKVNGRDEMKFLSSLWMLKRSNGTKYSRVDQVNFFKGCLPQNLPGPLLNTLSQILFLWYT